MNDRLTIASQIAAGIFSGVPYGLDDFEQTGEVKESEAKTLRAVARLSLMMADALLAEAASGGTFYVVPKPIREDKCPG